MFPNVHFEFSTSLPPYYLPALSKTMLREALKMVPTTRLVYGSDSHDSPEMHWLAAKLTNRAIAESIRELVAEGVVDEDDALKTERNILSRNALGLL